VTRISEFQIKDIVNIADGKKLGNMSDLEINTATGKIEAIVVSNGTRLMGFFWKRTRHCDSMAENKKDRCGCHTC
jgi:YlmC/YmxH family sporulation protein